MTASSTILGDRRRVAMQRDAAMKRHPSRRTSGAPAPRPAAFYLIAVIATVLTGLGLVMVLSATSISQFHKGNSPYRLFNRQVIWAGFGVLGLFVAMRTPTRRWRPLVVPAFVVSCGMMVLPFVPGIGLQVNDARSWVAVGSLSFQPSEFVKLTLLLACAAMLAARRDELHDLRRTFVPVMAMTTLAAALCLAQGDLGSAIVIGMIGLCMVFVAGSPMLPITASAALAGLSVVGFALTDSRRAARFKAFLDVAANKDRFSYQTWQAQIAMVQGGVTGSGVGQGQNKLGEFLPLAHSDFIFAVVAEELGIIGVIAVLGGFLALAYAGMQVASATPDPFHRLIAGGVVGWLVAQAFINVGGVVGLLPVTGLTLPFISAGGSSLFVTLVATGLLLNVARNVR
jgi:cell division protein FtsW